MQTRRKNTDVTRVKPPKARAALCGPATAAQVTRVPWGPRAPQASGMERRGDSPKLPANPSIFRGKKAGDWAAGLRKAEGSLRASDQGFHRCGGEEEPGRAGLCRAAPLGPAVSVRSDEAVEPRRCFGPVWSPLRRRSVRRLWDSEVQEAAETTRGAAAHFRLRPPLAARAPARGGGGLDVLGGAKRPPAVPPHHCSCVSLQVALTVLGLTTCREATWCSVKEFLFIATLNKDKKTWTKIFF